MSGNTSIASTSSTDAKFAMQAPLFQLMYSYASGDRISTFINISAIYSRILNTNYEQVELVDRVEICSIVSGQCTPHPTA
jgi:hypothetical protein